MKNSAELERLILGGVLAAKDPRRALDAVGLAPSDFSDNALRVAYDFAQRRATRRLEVSAIEVWNTARRVGKLQDDDLMWLQGLQAANTLDERALLRLSEDLRTIVRTRQTAARLRELAGEVERQLVTLPALGSNLQSLAHQLERSYQANRTAENDPGEVVDTWEANVRAGKTHQTPSGCELFDKEVGGWIPNLNLVVGKPSIGKSAFCASAIVSQLDLGQRVGIFGLEDGHRWISRRFIALDNALPVRAVGSKNLAPDEWLKVHDRAAELSKKMKSLLVHKWSGTTSAELVRIGKSWILNEGVEAIWLDNATSVRHGGQGGGGRFGQREAEFRVQVAQSVEAFRDLGENYGVPVIVLCHTTREYEEKRPYSSPELTDVAEGAAFERFARLFVGCWAKQWSNEFRLTVKKNIEGAPNLTLGFDRHLEQALIDLRSARMIDVRGEARKERQEKKGQAIEQRVEDNLFAAEVKKKKLEAMKGTPAAATPEDSAAAPPPQLSLLEVPPAPATSDAKTEEPKP